MSTSLFYRTPDEYNRDYNFLKYARRDYGSFIAQMTGDEPEKVSAFVDDTLRNDPVADDDMLSHSTGDPVYRLATNLLLDYDKNIADIYMTIYWDTSGML